MKKKIIKEQPRLSEAGLLLRSTSYVMPFVMRRSMRAYNVTPFLKMEISR